MEKILDIIDLISYEKGLKIEKVKDAIKEAVIKTAQKSLNTDYKYDVEIDEKSKILKLFQTVSVCEDSDTTEGEEKRGDSDTISLKEAKEIDESLEVGDELRYELNLDNMSRTVANTLHRELEFHIQRVLEDELFEKFKAQVGTIVTGSVVRVDEEDNTYIEIDEVRAILYKKNRIKGESFKVGNVVKSILKNVRIDRKSGIIIELSRTTPKFLEELLRLEVPEIADEDVIIHKCARIPGERAKVAISSLSPKIDPVGATVGVKGVRINSVSGELCNESIDCIEFSPIPEMFISRALSPALISAVSIEDGKAYVTIPTDQKPKAIGRSGINIRLASMLTGFEIELIEKASESKEIKDGEDESTRKDRSKKVDISSLASLFKD